MGPITIQVMELSDKIAKTRFGDKTTYSFKGSDGNWYKTGFKKPTFAKGDTIEFCYEENTYGKSIEEGTLHMATGTTGVPVTGSAVSPRNVANGPRFGAFPIPALDGQRSIVRQNALTNARELYVANITGAVDLDVAAKKIIHIATVFEAYTAGDMEMDAAKEAVKTKGTDA